MLVEPTGTLTLAGADTLVVVLEMATVVPPVGAASVRLTVQVAEAGAVSIAGVQLNELKAEVGWAVTDTVAVRIAPPAEAVTVTVCVEATAAAVRVKLADIAPAATVRLAGTVSAELLLETATANPPDAAVLFSVTVQEVDCPEAMLSGLQESAVSCTGTETLSVNDVDTPPAVAVS